MPSQDTVCLLKTNKGRLYVSFGSCRSQFRSTAVKNARDLPSFLNLTAKERQEEAKANVFFLTSQDIDTIWTYIEKLKAGKTLLVDEMLKLDNFVEFLDASIALHQDGFSRFPKLYADLSEWISELGFRD